MRGPPRYVTCRSWTRRRFEAKTKLLVSDSPAPPRSAVSGADMGGCRASTSGMHVRVVPHVRCALAGADRACNAPRLGKSLRGRRRTTRQPRWFEEEREAKGRSSSSSRSARRARERMRTRGHRLKKRGWNRGTARKKSTSLMCTLSDGHVPDCDYPV
eukprot:3509783-Rhodomonas_salina.3